MKRFEFKRETIDSEKLEKYLEDESWNGWEIKSIIKNDPQTYSDYGGTYINISYDVFLQKESEENE